VLSLGPDQKLHFPSVFGSLQWTLDSELTPLPPHLLQLTNPHQQLRSLASQAKTQQQNGIAPKRTDPQKGLQL
jgi:hypothetical protein